MNSPNQRSTRIRRSRAISLARANADSSDDSLDTLLSPIERTDGDVDQAGTSIISSHRSNADGNIAPEESTRPRKRTSKACENCKAKKSRCTGETPCGMCHRLNIVCQYITVDPGVSKCAWTAEEMAVEVKKNTHLERCIRAAHSRLLQVGDEDCPKHFAQFLGWLEEISPHGSFESRDTAASVRRPKRVRTKRSTRTNAVHLFQPRDVAIPIRGIQQSENVTEEGISQVIFPTIHQFTAQPDRLEGDRNSNIFDLSYIVQASNSPPIVRAVQHCPTTADATNEEHKWNSFGCQYSSTGTFHTNTTSPYTTGPSYVQTPPPYYGNFEFQFNNPPHSSEAFSFSEMDYHPAQDSSQMPNHQTQHPDDQNYDQNSSYYSQ